jgi:hypothetical protein
MLPADVLVFVQASNPCQQKVNQSVNSEVLGPLASHPPLDRAVPTLCDGGGVLTAMIDILSHAHSPHPCDMFTFELFIKWNGKSDLKVEHCFFLYSKFLVRATSSTYCQIQGFHDHVTLIHFASFSLAFLSFTYRDWS